MAIWGFFFIFLSLLLAAFASDQCIPDSLPSTPFASRPSHASGLWNLSVTGRVKNSTGKIPTFFRLSLFQTSPSEESVGGRLLLSWSPSDPFPLKRWNPRFNPAHPRQSAWRGPINGRFNDKNKLLCAKVCFRSNTTLCNALLSLKYPEARTIENPYVSGELRSLLPESDEGYFHPVSLTGVSNQEYEYTKLDQAQRFCAGNHPDSSGPMLTNLRGNSSVCTSGLSRVALNITSGCTKGSCYPFLGSSTSSALHFNDLRCGAEDQVTGFLQLGDDSREVSGENVLGVEGKWIQDRLCLVACRSEARNGSRDCSMLVSVQFPKEFNIHQRSPLVGSLRSQRPSSDPLSFPPISFRAGGQMFGFFFYVPERLSYSYSKVGEAMAECGASPEIQRPAGEFPSGYFFEDFSFLSASNRSSFFQLSLNEKLPWDSGYGVARVFESSPEKRPRSKVNVSFDITIDGEFIAAEGFYDSNTGAACMIGCKAVKKKVEQLEMGEDCKILIRVQFPGYNEKPENRKVVATISSLRKKKDELFFRQIKVTSYQSMYMAEAIESLWMKDLEIFLSMFTLSLEIFVLIFQIVHARKQPKLRQYASLVMLGILALGHMVPLVLNFEAMFNSSSSEKESIPSYVSDPSSSERELFKVKEVAIRLMNMVAFLLLLWLVQLVWNSRIDPPTSSTSAELSTFHEESRLIDDNNENSKEVEQASVGESNVILFCLPLYVVGALAASIRQWVLHQGFWSGLKAYAGLTLDLFLVPQVVAYGIWGVQVRALSVAFCVGMSVARLLPHGFDMYRVSRPALQLVQIDDYFANQEWDFFSLGWDIAIPCAAASVAAVVLLQQRFGGRCFIPGFVLNKFRL